MSINYCKTNEYCRKMLSPHQQILSNNSFDFFAPSPRGGIKKCKNRERRKNFYWIQVDVESLMEIPQWGFIIFRWEYLWWNLRGFLWLSSSPMMKNSIMVFDGWKKIKIQFDFYWAGREKFPKQAFDDKFSKRTHISRATDDEINICYYDTPLISHFRFCFLSSPAQMIYARFVCLFDAALLSMVLWCCWWW